MAKLNELKIIIYPFPEENLRKEAHKIIITLLCCIVQLEAMLLYAAYEPFIPGAMLRYTAYEPVS